MDGRHRGRGGSTPDPTVSERVLEAVIAELADSGIARLSMDRVAQRAGVSKTTVYTRWDTKAQLLAAAYGRVVTPLEPIDTGALATDLDVLWDRLLRGAADRRYLVALTEVIGAAATNDTLRAELHRQQASWRDGICGVLARARARGELPDDVDVDGLAQVVQSLTLWRAVIADLPIDQDFRALVERLIWVSPPRIG